MGLKRERNKISNIMLSQEADKGIVIVRTLRSIYQIRVDVQGIV